MIKSKNVKNNAKNLLQKSPAQSGRKPGDHSEKIAAECLQGLDLLRCQRDLSILLASTSDLTEGLNASLQASLQISGMDCGGIYLFDEAGRHLDMAVHHGLTEEFVLAVSHYDEDLDNVKLVKAGKPVYVLHNELKVNKSPAETKEGIMAIAVLPLGVDGKVIGCMNIGSHFTEDIPQPVRVALETTAAQVGGALSRLHTRAKLKESEGHLKALIESTANFAVYRLVGSTKHRKLEVQLASPSANDILGIPDIMQFDSWFKNMHPDDVDRIADADRKAFETNRFNEQFRIFNKKYGEWRWIHSVSSGVEDKEGEYHYVNGIMIDITDRKLIEEQLKESNTALKVVIQNIEKSTSGVEEKIAFNVKSVVLPLIERLKNSCPTANQSALIEAIESSLAEISSSFSKKLSSLPVGLTVKEIQVANLVRMGLTSKEIAQQMNVSPKTTNVHRASIRQKLGIDQKTNLRSYLLSFLDD